MTGDELKKLRERAGLKAFDVAQGAGMSPSALSLIETGRRPPKGDQEQRIVAAIEEMRKAHAAEYDALVRDLRHKKSRARLAEEVRG